MAQPEAKAPSSGTLQVNVRVRADLREQFRARCRERKLTEQGVIQTLIADWLATEGQ